MKKTLMSHFYNEEYLLPWFLNHHKQIFDHGVMIDYHSTDHSVEIIKEICPTWDIITSRNNDFQADLIDVEVNELEREITGWKICLNVTEQLIGDYTVMDTDAPNEIYVPSIFMVDTEYRTRTANPDSPLYEQYRNGFSFRDSDRDFLERRSRRLHNTNIPYPIQSTRECMAPGRHYNMYSNMDLAIFYYGWCPFDHGGIARKLQIQTQIPWIDRQRGWGFHHITNKETLTYRLENEFIPRSRDLTEDINDYVKQHKNLSNIL
jgi:hypothetical protein